MSSQREWETGHWFAKWNSASLQTDLALSCMRCRVSNFDQQGGHVRAVFEFYFRDVASEGDYVSFRRHPAPCSFREELHDEISRRLTEFPFLEWTPE